jgi:transposase
MVVIGVDPHKSSHTAAALDEGTHQSMGTVWIEATLAEYGRLLRWAKRFDERRWAVENAWGLGRHLSQWLIARGERVVDVAATTTARVRQLSRGGRRKTDVLDAAAAASVVALQGDAVPVAAETATTVLRMLDERRVKFDPAAHPDGQPAARSAP